MQVPLTTTLSSGQKHPSTQSPYLDISFDIIEPQVGSTEGPQAEYILS